MGRRRLITWERFIRWIAGLHVVFLVLLLWGNVVYGPHEADFHFMHSIGRLFLDGEWDSIYSVDHDGYFWRFPPHGLYPAAVAALFPADVGYWIQVVVQAASVGISLVLLSSLFPDMTDPDVALVAVLGSAPVLTTLAAGQNSGGLLLLVTTGLWLTMRGRERLGFATLGLLAIKPTIGAGFGLFAVVRRRRDEIAAIAGVAAIVVATSLPLVSLWDDFLRAVLRSEQIRAVYPAAKQITVLGFLDGAGLPAGPALVLATVMSIGLLVAAVTVWRSDVPVARKFGAACLLVVAANPYMSFYDSMLLVVPGMAWWGVQGTYGDRRIRLGIALCLAVAWFDQHLAFSYLAASELLPAFSMVGPSSAVWLVLESLDAARREAVAVPRPWPACP